MRLKEKACYRCPQCNKLYFDTLGIKHKVCISCKTPNIRESYYSRLKLERFAFIYTLSMIISVSLLMLVNWENTKAGPGFVVFLFLIAIPGLLLFIYYAVNEYLSGTDSESKNSKKELSIFKEIYLSNNKPTYDELAFSWHRYFKEAISFVGILVIFVILGAGILLFKKLFN